MKKADIIPVVIILILLLSFQTIDRKFLAKIFPAKPRPIAEAVALTSVPADTELTAPSTVEAAVAIEEAPEAAVDPATDGEAVVAPEADLTTLGNEYFQVVFSTLGASAVEVNMMQYPVDSSADAPPVSFDFASRPALALTGIPGLTPSTAYHMVSSTETSVTYQVTLESGLVHTRGIELRDHYGFFIVDKFTNPSSAGIELPENGMQLGWMVNLPSEKEDRVPNLGVDSKSGSESTTHWSGKFEDLFRQAQEAQAAPLMPSRMEYVVPGGRGVPRLPITWAGVKNKYFAQVLTPAVDASDAWVKLSVQREVPVGEPKRTFFTRKEAMTPIQRVSATVYQSAVTVAPLSTHEQTASWYVGPKLYAELKAGQLGQEDILQLGFWRVIGVWILRIMVWFKDHVWPYNYGVAIILLTFLIRVIFWPLNHKSMVSTRHMQQVQPLITEMKNKFKDDPQRQQQEMMAIYKEHKINPMGGCLPMLIQIPVFFALFVVLRGAIELRFSSFLWISDLSTPENLFVGVLPIPLNILPLFMGFTMWFQQRLTPTSDPQQQKMMLMMPVIFTALFYNFPSGLSLYWTTNQVLMIAQLLWMRHKYPNQPKGVEKKA